MAEIPNADNLIDYSRKDIIKTNKDSQELVTQYEWKINEDSLKKLWDTLKLSQVQLNEVRTNLQKTIAEVKNSFQNPNIEKKSKNIEARYDDLMYDLWNLNTVAARQISELLWLDVNRVWSNLDSKTINDRTLPDISKYTENLANKLWIKSSPWKPVIESKTDSFQDWVNALKRWARENQIKTALWEI